MNEGIKHFEPRFLEKLEKSGYDVENLYQQHLAIKGTTKTMVGLDGALDPEGEAGKVASGIRNWTNISNEECLKYEVAVKWGNILTQRRIFEELSNNEWLLPALAENTRIRVALIIQEGSEKFKNLSLNQRIKIGSDVSQNLRAAIADLESGKKYSEHSDSIPNFVSHYMGYRDLIQPDLAEYIDLVARKTLNIDFATYESQSLDEEPTVKHMLGAIVYAPKAK